MLRRRTVLALMLIGAVPAFALINTAVSAARARRETIAADWAHRGDLDLAAGRGQAAAEDFQTADQYARDRNTYRPQLAAALESANRLSEAEAQLLVLWNARPGDGEINLRLARVCARQGRVVDAVRYYHAAIDGAWETGAARSRRTVRLELARFLLASNERPQAQAELMALAAEFPSAPNDPAEARLAGEVAFDTGDYRAARRDLDRAREAGLDADGQRMLDVSTRVLALDPYARGIRSRERLARIVRAFAIADAALERCPGDALAPQRIDRDALKPSIDEHELARDPDAVDATLAFAASAITAVRAACGPGGPDEAALALVLQQRRPAS